MSNVNNPKVDGCCGCGACLNICPKNAISFVEDNEGFMYPSVDEGKCVDCSLCVKVCPVLDHVEERRPLKVFAAKNKDFKERRSSTSGGIFLPLAYEIIRRGGAVFGVEMSDDFRVARHACAENADEVRRFSGSKYLQSDTSDTYTQVKKILSEGRPVLYSGTPCQIAGLKHFLGKEWPGLYTVDIICHGVPSPKVWRMYLDSLRIKDISSVGFRDKVTGWKVSSLVITDGDGKVAFSETIDRNVYLQGFLKNLYIRPSCHKCPSKAGRSCSDLTIADFWGIKKFHPDFDDNDGVGLVFVNTPSGESLFDSLDFEKISCAYEEAVLKNASYYRNSPVNASRTEFFRKLDRTRRIRSLIGRYTADPYKVRLKRYFKNKLKRFFSL